MKHGSHDGQRIDPSKPAAFLETFRCGFSDAPALLETFDTCLAEYQEALIHLLLSEVQSEEQRENASPAARLTHAQQVIADAQTFERHQRLLTTYLEARRRLKVAVGQVHALPRNRSAS